MRWFRKEPPPPPKPKVPIWVVQLIVPIIFAILMAMGGFIVNGIASDVETNRKEKADNSTVILFIEKQKETDDRQWKVIEYLLQQNQKVQQTDKVVIKKEEKPPLSFQEYKEYLKLKPEEREVFRKLHPAYESLPK